MMKKKPLPVSIDNWFKLHQDDVLSLTEMMNSPAMQRAIATLHEAAMPDAIRSVDKTAELNNNRFVWLAGYCDFARDLQKLTTPPSPKNTNQPEEWTHL